jgi:hypothetical protein
MSIDNHDEKIAPAPSRYQCCSSSSAITWASCGAISGRVSVHRGHLRTKPYHKAYFLGIDQRGVLINPALLALAA